jgi:DNA mismatch endonuclease (patch repair protein)
MTNREFWMNKIRINKARDRKVQRMFRAMGWKAVRIWEHELKNDCFAVLQKVLVSRSHSH